MISLRRSGVVARVEQSLTGWHVARERLLGASAGLRNVPFALFVFGILAYGAAFAYYMLGRFDLVNLLRDVIYDDAFYYFQIAYHMTEGKFSTFDGITRTNGYHPLWLFLITPLYWLFDKTEALFAVTAFEIALIAAGAALVVAAARVAHLPWILLFAVAPALFAQTGMLFGLESALVLFVLGLLMLAVCLFVRDPARWRWLLAVVVFVMPWARLECVVVAVAAVVALGFLEWSGRLSCATDSSSPRAMGRPDRSLPRLLRLQAAVPLASACAGLLVYFAYNGIVFGGVVPVSGAVKTIESQLYWDEKGGYDLAANFERFARTGPYDDELLTALEVCAYALLAWWFSRGFRSREDALLLAFLAGVAGLAAGHLAKFAHSVLFMHPNTALQPWYFVPAYLTEALIVPLRCYMGIYLIRRFVLPRLPRSAHVLRLAAIAAAAAVLVAKVDFAEPFWFVDSSRDDTKKKDANVRGYMGAAVMDRLLPEGTLVGSWDAGAIGYFSRLPVMNLDGYANSYDYKEALEEGDYRAFWRRHGLVHFGNVYSLGGLGGRPSQYSPNARFLFKAARGSRLRHGGLQFKLYANDANDPAPARSQGDVASSIRERIGPHLEPQADGVGLLVKGRTAQAFAWDCATDEDDVAEWTFGGRVGAVSDWTQTADGLCSSDILLPHGHGGPLHVRRAPLAEAVAGLVGERVPAIPADSVPAADAAGGFDVYLAADALIYVKAACERADVDTPFFLHLVPVGDDFDDGRESHGYNNLDFMFWQHNGDWFGEERYGKRGKMEELEGEKVKPCLAEIPLPSYGIAEIRTGQYVPTETGTTRLWSGAIIPD